MSRKPALMTVPKHYTAPKLQSKKEPSWFVLTLVSGMISGVILFFIGWYISLSAPEKQAVVSNIFSAKDIFPDIVGLNRSKVLLVMGVDMPPRHSKEAYESVRTDTMMLVRVDAADKKVNIVSIPRDSKVYIAGGHGVNKINAAFPLGGPETALATVQETFGVDVDDYLVVNLRGVKDFVDALGGIDVYVEKPMFYQDRTAGLYINLKPGMQHLNGREAEGFLRFRHDALGDIGRIRRQQQFIAGVAKKLKDSSLLLRIKPLLTASNEHIKTNMSTPDLVRLALFGKNLSEANFEVATLPGHPSLNSQVSYWVIDPEPAEAVLNRLIVGENPEDAAPADPQSGKPTVGILYTASHRDVLPVYREQLEELGFDVACRTVVRRSGTRLVTHNANLPKAMERKLQGFNPVLKHAQLIFSPHGATFETNSCGHTDYTLVLGDDTRRPTNP